MTSSNFGEIKLKATSSANPENLFTKVEEKEKFYYQVSIKPECDMNHRQSAKEIADIERNIPFYIAKQIKPNTRSQDKQ